MGFLFNMRYVSGLVAPQIALLPPVGNVRPQFLVSREEWNDRLSMWTKQQITGRYIPVLLDFGNCTRVAKRCH